MQQASTATSTKISYLAVVGPQTTGNAMPYITTLAQRRCTVILGVGEAQTRAIQQAAAGHPAIHFLITGTESVNAARNIATLGTGDSVRSATATAVTRLTRH